MKKKSIYVGIFSLVVWCLQAFSAFAQSPSVSDSLQRSEISQHIVSTNNLKEKADPVGNVVPFDSNENVKPLLIANTLKHRKQMTNEVTEKRKQEINNYLTLIAAGEEPKFTKEFFAFLKDHDLVYYQLEKKKNDSTVKIQSTTDSDLSLTTPFITYDSAQNAWQVWGGFHYSNDNGWWTDVNHIFSPVGNIGGTDMLGLYLSGGTSGAALIDQFMQPIYHDAPYPYNEANMNGTNATRINYRSGSYAPSDRGGMYEAQDAIHGYGTGPSGYAEYANDFGSGAVMLEYDSNFANASGNATSYYAHTWSSSGIQSISVSDTGVSVTFSNTSYKIGPKYGDDYAY